MNIGEMIKDTIKVQGRTAAWVADQMDINGITFRGKLSRNSISADDLLKIAPILNINLEELSANYNANGKKSSK